MKKVYLKDKCVDIVGYQRYRMIMASTAETSQAPATGDDRAATRHIDIRVRVSKEEQRLLAAEAKSQGLKTSTWLRLLGMREVARRLEMAPSPSCLYPVGATGRR